MSFAQITCYNPCNAFELAYFSLVKLCFFQQRRGLKSMRNSIKLPFLTDEITVLKNSILPITFLTVLVFSYEFCILRVNFLRSKQFFDGSKFRGVTMTGALSPAMTLLFMSVVL